jgi:hypothetical protein
MYVNTITNLEAFNAEITPLVSDNNVMANLSPLSRPVKVLVEIPVVPKGRLPNDPGEIEIVKSLF